MTAPKNNKFWQQRSKHGRDRLFENAELLLEAAYEYFNYCDTNPLESEETEIKAVKGTDEKGNDKTLAIKEEKTKKKNLGRPYTLEGFILYCGASESWLRQFKRSLDPEKDQDFFTVIEQIETIIRLNQKEGAIVGKFNANIIARLQGISEKVEQVNINHEVPLSEEQQQEILKRLNEDY